MLTLHKFMPAWGLPDLSPFCIKAETYLRMVGVPFQVAVADTRKAPKAKLPYLVDGSLTIADSRDIIDHVEKTLERPLDADLSAEQRAIVVAFRGLLEEEAYYLVIHQRWKQDAGWRTYIPIMSGYLRQIGVPGPIAPLVAGLVRRQMVRTLWGQGIGRHSAEQVDARALAIVEAVCVQLGDKPFFLGDEPRTIDATVYAFMATLLDTPFESEAATFGRAQDNLCAYTRRIREQYFSNPA